MLKYDWLHGGLVKNDWYQGELVKSLTGNKVSWWLATWWVGLAHALPELRSPVSQCMSSMAVTWATPLHQGCGYYTSAAMKETKVNLDGFLTDFEVGRQIQDTLQE